MSRVLLSKVDLKYNTIHHNYITKIKKIVEPQTIIECQTKFEVTEIFWQSLLDILHSTTHAVPCLLSTVGKAAEENGNASKREHMSQHMFT